MSGGEFLWWMLDLSPATTEIFMQVEPAIFEALQSGNVPADKARAAAESILR